MFVGAVLVTACLVMAETGLRSHLPAHRLAGADLVVSGRQSVPTDQDLDVPLPDRAPVRADVVHRIAAVDGVQDASADTTFAATLLAENGTPLAVPDVRHNGHAWSRVLLPDKAFRGVPPHGRDQLALSVDAASAVGTDVGDRVHAVLDGRTRTMTVTAVVDSARGVYVDQATARRLAQRRGTVDLVAVSVDHGTPVAEVADRVRRALSGTGLVVTTGAARGDVENPSAAAGSGELITVAGSAGGVIVLLVGFLVAGAVTISVTNRARELALLRAVGATPRQVRALVARQSSRTAFTAIPAGVAVGYLLSRPLLTLLAHHDVVSSELPVAWSPAPAVLTALLLLGAVGGASRLSSWRISRAPATRAVADTGTEPATGGVLRTRTGIALLVLPLVASVVPLFARNDIALISAASGILLAMIGLAMAAPAAVRSLGRRASRRLAARNRAVPTWLAANNSGAYALRTGGALSVLALAITLTMTQLFTGTTIAAAAQHDQAAAARAAAVVTADSVGGVTPSTLSAIRQAAGVRAAVPMSATTVVLTSVNDGQRQAEALPATALGHSASSALDLQVTHGDLDRLSGDTAALDSFTASTRGIGIGDRFTAILADGSVVHPQLVATYARSFGFGKVVLSTDLLTAHGSPASDSVLIVAQPGATDLVRHVRAAVRGMAGVDVAARALPASLVGAADPTAGVSLLITLVLLGYVLLGVANRLVATTARRRKEWATLRAIGMAPAQIRRMVRAEVGLIVGGAVVVGLGIALVPMTLISIGLVGEPWPQGPPLPVALVCLVVAATAYGATMVTTRRTLRGSMT
ncbi:FtsX-like permease family protein [Flexivirga sp.]|uniref:FtsX-like permease family protein n=1 Tax=Flexivirga sp. TaxID=1962927 RepID=UPI003F7D946F